MEYKTECSRVLLQVKRYLANNDFTSTVSGYCCNSIHVLFRSSGPTTAQPVTTRACATMSLCRNLTLSRDTDANLSKERNVAKFRT